MQHESQDIGGNKIDVKIVTCYHITIFVQVTIFENQVTIFIHITILSNQLTIFVFIQFDIDFDKRQNGNMKHRNGNVNEENCNLNAPNCNTKVLPVYCTILYDFQNGNPNEKW